jgi:hypothetical protein
MRAALCGSHSHAKYANSPLEHSESSGSAVMIDVCAMDRNIVFVSSA